MKHLNLIFILAPFIVFAVVDGPSFADVPLKKKTTPFTSASLLDPPAGYVYINQNEYSDINNLPLEIISDARREFRENNFASAGQDLHFAAQIMKLQAEGDAKNNYLKDTAGNLEKLSKRVSNNRVASLRDLDSELTGAASAQAEHHYLQAVEHWSRHMIKNVRIDLAASSLAIDHSIEWSGRGLEAKTNKAISSTKTILKELAEGKEWNGDQVDRAIAYVGNEINLLEKPSEPKTKTSTK